MKVELVWVTPCADARIGEIARVSNPGNVDAPVEPLLAYMARMGHWSPFEMASVCLEIETTRDIARQILRHRSFSFQEFSQRYASIHVLPEAELRECRTQDTKNRQNSLPNEDEELEEWWKLSQSHVASSANLLYKEALKRGIAKEQARALLPEGMTTSRLYMAGTLRSWITYLKQRLDPSTQKEHRLIAEEVLAILKDCVPITMNAFFK